MLFVIMQENIYSSSCRSTILRYLIIAQINIFTFNMTRIDIILKIRLQFFHNLLQESLQKTFPHSMIGILIKQHTKKRGMQLFLKARKIQIFKNTEIFAFCLTLFLLSLTFL